MNNPPLILAMDTSCDETAAAVTRGTKVLSNIIWSQASAHAKFGGVMPSLAARMHEERIGWVIDRATKKAGISLNEIEAIAVTVGPGLAIALGVGINEAKRIASKLRLPIIPINHIEGHLFSSLATSPNFDRTDKIVFPALGIVVSGGHTELIEIISPGNYRILARTEDDALGEALDKAARMLGFGYPGGAILEKIAKSGKSNLQLLPLPMARREDKLSFSYSGIKTALWRLIENTEKREGKISKETINIFAATFQHRAFQHFYRISHKVIENSHNKYRDILVGGGVTANIELRKIIRKMAREDNMKAHFPYTKQLTGDNAAMIGIAAYFGLRNKTVIGSFPLEKVDRIPRLAIDQKL